MNEISVSVFFVRILVYGLPFNTRINARIYPETPIRRFSTGSNRNAITKRTGYFSGFVTSSAPYRYTVRRVFGRLIKRDFTRRMCAFKSGVSVEWYGTNNRNRVSRRVDSWRRYRFAFVRSDDDVFESSTRGAIATAGPTCPGCTLLIRGRNKCRAGLIIQRNDILK